MQVANKLADLPNVIGYNTLNEPARGYIGISNLNTHFGELQMGVSPTPWQSMLLAAGLPQRWISWTEPILVYERRAMAGLTRSRNRSGCQVTRISGSKAVSGK